MIQGGSSN